MGSIFLRQFFCPKTVDGGRAKGYGAGTPGRRSVCDRQAVTLLRRICGGDLVGPTWPWKGYPTYALDPSRVGPLIEDVWPCLFFGTERIPEVRRKIALLGWARHLYARMLKESRCVLRSPPQLRQGRPGWRHDFYSPHTGAHLAFDPLQADGFRDPSDGSLVTGEPQRAAWVLLQHERLYRLMRSLAVLYQLTRRQEYSDWVARGVLSAADFFQRAERNHPYGATYFQPLYDAQVITLLANAYDLTRDSPSFEPGAHEHIRRVLFEGGSSSLLAYQRVSKVHNITCYVAAAIGTLGALLDEPALLGMALSEEESGLQGLLREGLGRDPEGRSDGMWHEGTTFYHIYAMCPLFCLHELARRWGLHPGRLSGIHRDLVAMARAPTLLVDERLRLPWLGDLGFPEHPGLRSFSHIYEYAAGMLDPSFSAVLASCEAGLGRAGLTALAFGPDLASGRGVPQAPSFLPDGGIAVLRSKDKLGSLYVLLRSGRHGGGHDHRDKLQIVMHGMGEVIAPDLGTAGYSLKDFKDYCSSTLGHNTLMVDEADQSQVADADLFIDSRCSAKGVLRDAYQGVVLERKVVLDPPCVLVDDTFSSPDSHRYSWVFHAKGKLEVQVDGARRAVQLPPLPNEGPYGFFRSRTSLGTARRALATWEIGEGLSLLCDVRWDAPFECTAGTTPNNPMTSDLGALVLRCPGSRRQVRAEFRIVRH